MPVLLPSAIDFRAGCQRFIAPGAGFFRLLLVLLAAAHPVRAQVPNDDIEHRRLLQPEEIVSSSTTDCTVQRGCVDERLTGRCIEYHNDQWFEFTPAVAGRYFVNVSGQWCRDVRGVQLVVLRGQPCQPATYRVLSCTSLGTQDDVFVTLDSLAAGQPYLLDVDGYLKDFCRFSLQVSRRPAGLPATYQPPNPVRLRPVTGFADLTWQVPDSLAGSAACRVLRREIHAYQSTEVARLPLRRDTFGQLLPAYTWRDSLPGPGQYYYRVVSEAGPDGPAPVQLLAQWVASGEALPAPPTGWPAAPAAQLPLADFPRRSALSIVVTEPGSGRVLLAWQLVRDPASAGQGILPVASWRAQGIVLVLVVINCQPMRGHKFSRQLLWKLPAETEP